MNPHTPTLELTQLSKKLGGREVLKQVDLIVQPGEVVGIVGSNGSGKTTLLRLVTGLIYPDRGVIRVKGKRVRPGLLGDLPLSVGALIETPSFLPQFSGFQNLTMLASIQQKIDKTDVYQVMKQVGLDPENRKPVRTYSLGMRQRLGIAQAVMEDPCLLLFDEPTNALDDHGVETFSSLLQELIEKGASVLLVSHVKGEIQRFCDRVFQIEEGKLLSVQESTKQKWRLVVSSWDDVEKLTKRFPHLQIDQPVNGYPAVVCISHWVSQAELTSEMMQDEIQVIEVQKQI